MVTGTCLILAFCFTVGLFEYDGIGTNVFAYLHGGRVCLVCLALVGV